MAATDSSLPCSNANREKPDDRAHRLQPLGARAVAAARLARACADARADRPRMVRRSPPAATPPRAAPGARPAAELRQRRLSADRVRSALHRVVRLGALRLHAILPRDRD